MSPPQRDFEVARALNLEDILAMTSTRKSWLSRQPALMAILIGISAISGGSSSKGDMPAGKVSSLSQMSMADKIVTQDVKELL